MAIKRRTRFKKLNPIEYRELKQAIRAEMEKSEDFSDQEIALFVTMMDRIGRESITEFIFIASKFSGIQVSEDSWAEAKETVQANEEEKEERREKWRGKV